MKRNNQRGSALVFALILVLVLSAMAGSLVFLSRSETFSSMNYRMMTQARYGAEAGVNAAANFIMNTYVPPPAPPGPAGGSFLGSGFNASVYPVTDVAGNPIYLSTLSTQPANYPNAGMQTQFANAASGTLQAGMTNVNYTASAQLMSMVSVQPFGTTTNAVIQTWKITAHGDIPNVQNGEAEVVTTLERYITPAFGYAAFAQGNGCGQLQFSGNGTTNGYDSGGLSVSGGQIQPPSSSQLLGYGGNVGTNGNELDSGSNVQINGTLSSPNAGFGVCTAGNMTALSGGSANMVKGGMIQLPQPVTFPPPATYPPGSTSISLNGNQSQTLTPGVAPCAATGPCSLGDISVNAGPSGNSTCLTNCTGLTLTPGVYNINSLSIQGNGQITIAPDPVTGQYGQVIINVAGNGAAASAPITITGNSISNPSYDPSLVQITYAGNGTIMVAGKGATAAVIYAPNAIADFKGNGTLYGSVIANKMVDVGNGAIYYDMKLKRKMVTIGQYVLSSFTWNKY